MNAPVTDSRRRLVMPPELPARSPVTVQQLDADTWLVRGAHPIKAPLVALLPDIPQLPTDPEWQEIESRIVAHTSRTVAPI